MESMIDETIKTENMETTTFEESERLAREQIEADYAAHKAVQDTAQEEIVQAPQEEIVQDDGRRRRHRSTLYHTGRRASGAACKRSDPVRLYGAP